LQNLTEIQQILSKMATLMRPHKLVLGVVIGTILFGGIITLSIVFINNNKVATNATSK
jgi:hypothetical protein